MSIEVKVPVLPESVADATIAAWHKKVGDKVSRDENLLDLETDKVVLEVPAPVDGILSEIMFQEGDTVHSGQLLAKIKEGDAAEPKEEKKAGSKEEKKAEQADSTKENVSAKEDKSTSPVVRRMMAEHDLQPGQIQGSGKDGRITKEDVLAYIESSREKSSKPAESPKEQTTQVQMGVREERRVPMTRLRAKIAERLLAAQHNAAMLTTFNEVNLKAVMDMRAQYKDSFEKKHGVKLGFMSFFTKAVVESLKRFPAVNASIDGQDVVYHGFYDIGIAVSTDRGLVVPVIRDADQMSMANIELAINDAATKARQGKLAMEDMQGGTFTITNGGVFGSLLATPIINPPQTGILGMHKIEERPVVEKGQIVIRPMMYVALSYDHRLIDGKDSVQFLVSVKELLEDPARLLLNV
ncbi:2-oxoglutarate dehydrogenase complex dihydrolipoyllysine-residue succinyltransferase [Legionella longbeachae]|uniref:Dihydrolipoyllysine-residue succinyltransferase component of 2-oxoglutarate dehydrogenase complex n=1 Tax=Legionella longbeachae serogroup 1 (strain NSW150) TaxID=661367 RepID=D3HPB5_LEGLN|nr:2-oxoglutarate dehydrogenase complex dihydrolipoyllysine-residue succinyltransferase [Legionella longbeachae]VEE01254.1 dihydrolipoamide succinyltransferase subunit E2 [Legionella oakridgensis]HBD7398309.1 2-oxoglutarate dehydrogenase complex dihydrolipoyllysine-residue succinyltransferase [Legionella pneumophila]ARB92378.1 dihydrolipoyllysine-residue succinyltransferase [Legionella longbeachae]ARM34441.1 2-oxoglutarate dehydrogenase complex dihydrolipoyllysine-residue succinyltransferase [L